MNKGFALSLSALVIAASATSALAGGSRAINRSGVESRWSGGHSTTTVTGTLNSIRHENGSTNTRAIKMDVIVPKSGDLKFKVDNNGAGVWSHQGKSSFLYSDYSDNKAYRLREEGNFNINTVEHSHYEDDYSGYVIEAETNSGY